MECRRIAALLALSSLTFTPHAFAQARPEDPAFKRLRGAPAAGGDGHWDGSLGLGVTINRGNNDSSQASLTVDANRTGVRSRTILHGLFLRATTKSQRTTDNQLFEGRHERNVTHSTFGFGDVTYERDPFRDLTLRQTYALGAGYRLLQEPEKTLNVYAGAAYTFENHRTAQDAEGVEPLLGNDFSYKISESATFNQRWVIYPHTVGLGGMRSIFQIDLNTHITDRFGLQLSVLNKYRQHVPANEKHSDTIIFTGITAGF